ncbi:MAG: 3'-5' exonuclease [Cyanobacteria bacterium P01_A01_bin.105]
MAKKSSQKYQGQSALLSRELLAFYRRVSTSLLTVVDLETTGSVANQARVIEVSILQATLADGILDQQTHLINPHVKIPEKITEITGITPSMVGGAPPPEEIWVDCESWLNQGILTAHNIDFDYGFLQAEFQRMDGHYYRPPSHRFCTVILSRLMLADLPSRRLPRLVRHFGFEVGPSHRAESDTKACWLLAEYLLKRIQNDPEAEILNCFRQQWIRLQDAAAILGLPKAEARLQLDEAGVKQRLSKRSQTILYRRGPVEDLRHRQQGEQLSVFT